MIAKKTVYVIANFGGPRSLSEVEPFLQELLTDRDVIRTNYPTFIHHFLFSRIAKKRARKVVHDYQSIGGKSPIFDDTEAVVNRLKELLNNDVISFHRYLCATHREFLKTIESLDCEEIRVFPLFPQFTYATTGSIARWFSKQLHPRTLSKVRWIKSYAAHPAFIKAHQEHIRRFLKENQLKDEETILLFSAHGIPESFVETGDIYADECQASYGHVMEAFPYLKGKLSFQSRFGPEEWLKPYTIDVCENIDTWREGRGNVVFIPISFTSDHVETLFEVETEYMTVIRKKGLNAYRVPALTLDPAWIQAIVEILKETNLCNNHMLVRKT